MERLPGLAVLQEAAAILQAYLSVPRALGLRLLSRSCKECLDASATFWLAVFDRQGLAKLYATVPPPQGVSIETHRRGFLRFVLSDHRMWQQFRFRIQKEVPLSEEVSVSKIRSSRALSAARCLNTQHRCPFDGSAFGCRCDTGARLCVETGSEKQRSISIVDHRGAVYRLEHLAKMALSSDLSRFKLAKLGTQACFTLSDGIIAFTWREQACPVGSRLDPRLIVSLHRPCSQQLQLLRILRVPENYRLHSVFGRGYEAPVIISSEDGRLLLYDPVKGVGPSNEPESGVEIFADSFGRPIEFVEVTTKLLAFTQKGGQTFTFLQRVASGVWQTILTGSMGYRGGGARFSVIWDLERTEAGLHGGGYSANSNTPKCAISLTSEKAAVPHVAAEGMCLYANGVLCFPVFSLAERVSAFPTPQHPTLFTLRAQNYPHEVELHYFPPDTSAYRIVPFPDPADPVEAVLSVEADEPPPADAPTVYRSCQLPPFVFAVPIGSPVTVHRWRGLWVACVRNLIKMVKTATDFESAPVTLLNLAGHESAIYCSDLDPATNRLITIEQAEKAILWDLSRGKKMTRWNLLDLPTSEEKLEEALEDEDTLSSGDIPNFGSVPSPVRESPAPSVPQESLPCNSEQDFPALQGEVRAPTNTVWSQSQDILRTSSSGEPPVEEEQSAPRLSPGSAAREMPDVSDELRDILIELSTQLNLPIEVLIATHAEQVMWDERQGSASPAVPKTVPPQGKRLITSIAREVSKDYVPERLQNWLSTQGDSRGNTSSSAGSRRRARQSESAHPRHATTPRNDNTSVAHVRSVVRHLGVRGGCVTDVKLTHSTLTFYYKSLNRLQTWFFKNNSESI